MTGTDTPATAAAAAAGIEHRVVSYGRVASAEEAARARGVPLGALVKTIVVRISDDDFRLIAIPGDRAIDWPKLRAVLGVSRASLADHADLPDITGYMRGTVTPLGATRIWPLVIDAELAELGEVSIGGGAHGVAIHLSPADLASQFHALIADVSKPAA